MNDATRTGVEEATGFDLVKVLRDVSLSIAGADPGEGATEEDRERVAQLCTLLDLAAVTLERLGGERLRPFCAFCGHESPEMGRAEVNDAIRAHVMECPGHPMRAEIERLRAACVAMLRTWGTDDEDAIIAARDAARAAVEGTGLWEESSHE